MIVSAAALRIPGRLQPTSLMLEAGLTCLIGPNGSGKTSLLHALAGIGGAAGSVTIGGVPLAAAPPAQRRRLLAFLPASREVLWPLAGLDLIALGGGEAGPDLLAELGIADLAERRVDRLSTGERSRVLIARALAPRPRLLLLDEPVANLDPLWQLRLLDHLRRSAREQGQAALVAMHDLELSRAFADRLIVMEGGRIAADGDADTLLDGPEIARIFGIERAGAGWRPVRRPEDRRSSP